MIRESVDAAVIGAGPAGCAASLRLLALGYRVALIESRAFPRPQIGESLSPGIWGMLEFLDAASVASVARSLGDLPARVAWQSRDAELIPAEQRGPGVMVDRGDFDARLADLARARGARLIQPARLRRIEGGPGGWRGAPSRLCGG